MLINEILLLPYKPAEPELPAEANDPFDCSYTQADHDAAFEAFMRVFDVPEP